MSRFHQRLAAALVAAAALALPADALAQGKTIKYAHFQPARLDQPKHAAALAFKAYVEANTNGSVKVQVYPASQLGDATPVLEGLKLGTIEMGVVHDGPIAGVFKPFIVFSIPYLFDDQQIAWRVLDGPYGREFGEAMRKQTGIRVLALADNGIRHFTNSVRPLRTPADMKGLKIRIQPSPVYQKLVEALGASASPVPWTELPAALQQKVVDGQENGVTNILAASLHQYQKHISLDGHVYSLHAYLISDRFFSRLTPQEQAVVRQGVEIAKVIHRGMTTAQDMNAKTILEEVGMTVTTLSPQEVDAFRRAAQPPVTDWVAKEAGKEWVDRLFAAVETAKRESR